MNHEATGSDTKRGARNVRARLVWSHVASVLLLVCLLQLVEAPALAQKRRPPVPPTQKQKHKDEQTTAAEQLVEEKPVEQAALPPPPRPAKLIRTSAYIRYNGPAAWALVSGAAKVESFFLQKFGRQLPISAYGQTAVHNRLGFDHRNAMDVPVNPNSAEGQALMAYLRANGITFFAFYMAIPGSATGPHINIRQPS